MSDPLCMIPARWGSKRIPNKNFRPLAGQTPLHRAHQCSSDAFPDATVIVSSDVRAYWVYPPPTIKTVHHYAPSPLHDDDCSMVDVVLDVLGRFPGPSDQHVLLVQPTQPFRRPFHLQHADWLLRGCASVASLAETLSVDKLYRRGSTTRLVPLGGGVERDQHGSPTYYCDGTVYGFRRGWFLVHRAFRDPYSTVTFVVPPEETCRLDTPSDWHVAELRLRDREGSHG